MDLIQPQPVTGYNDLKNSNACEEVFISQGQGER